MWKISGNRYVSEKVHMLKLIPSPDPRLSGVESEMIRAGMRLGS
jgi:hypothetical protein